MVLIGQQVEGEDAPFPQAAFQRHPAAVGLGDVLDDGQAQAGAAPLPAPACIHPVKTFKDAGQVLRGNAAALIFDLDDDFGAGPFRFQMDNASRAAEFDGIID